MCDDPSTSKPQVDGNFVKAIFTTGKQRSPVLPQVPTAREQGLAFDVTVWQGLFLAKDTPEPIVRTLNAALSKTWTCRWCARASKRWVWRSRSPSAAARNTLPNSSPRKSRAGRVRSRRAAYRWIDTSSHRTHPFRDQLIADLVRPAAQHPARRVESFYIHTVCCTCSGQLMAQPECTTSQRRRSLATPNGRLPSATMLAQVRAL